MPYSLPLEIRQRKTSERCCKAVPLFDNGNANFDPNDTRTNSFPTTAYAEKISEESMEVDCETLTPQTAFLVPSFRTGYYDEKQMHNNAHYEIQQMPDSYDSAHGHIQSEYFLSPLDILSRSSTSSRMSCDSAIQCDPMEYSATEDRIEDQIQSALSHSVLPRLPAHKVSELLGGALDKLLPMEKTTILVTRKDYSIYRYWSQQETIFGHNPDSLQTQSIELILNSKSFNNISTQQRTESYEECILFCGDRIKVITSTKEDQWMSFWMKESKADNEEYYTFVFVDTCVPIVKIQINETGHITECPIIAEEIDFTDYIDYGPEELQGHHYKQVIPTVENWHTSKHGMHYFITQHDSSVEIIALPTITGLVSIYYDKTIAWCSESLSCCLFGETPQQVQFSKIIDRLPEYPYLIDNWFQEAHYIDSTFSLKDWIHGATLMYEWCCNKFGMTIKDDPRLVALRQGIETEVELYVKFSSREDVPHWVFVKNILKWGTSLSSYKVIENRIGQGSYGSVYTAYDKRSLRKVTIKNVDKSRVIRENNRGNNSLPIEIEVLKLLEENRHKNCCEMYTYFDDPAHYYIVMGNYGKTLYNFIEENPDLTENASRHIFKQIAAAVNHLHEELNVVHRDLKDENIMIDEHQNIRLIDFGSAAILKTKGKKFNTFVGTVDYAAPEVLGGQTYSGKPQDIWALGVLLYTIIHHMNPFNTPADIIARKLVFPFALDEDLRSLIVGMLSGIRTRHTIAKVVSHKWIHKA